MDRQRPRSREKNVTDTKKTVQKRGSGLGTGPVGRTPGQQWQTENNPSGAGSAGKVPKRSGVPGGGLSKILILLAALVLGGGGALLGLPSGQAPSGTGQISPGQGQASPGTGQSTQVQGTGVSLSSLLGSLGGGSVSSGWLEPAMPPITRRQSLQGAGMCIRPVRVN